MKPQTGYTLIWNVCSETHIVQQGTRFGSEHDPCHIRCLPLFGDTLLLIYPNRSGASDPDFWCNRGASPIPNLTSYATNRRQWLVGLVITTIFTRVPKNWHPILWDNWGSLDISSLSVKVRAHLARICKDNCIKDYEVSRARGDH